MIARSFLILVVAATMAGCDAHPSTPLDPAAEPSASLLGRDGGGVTVPMTVEFAITFQVDQSPEALAACAPRPGIARGTGFGEGTHLGRFEVVKAEHCSIDLAQDPPVFDGVGEFVFAAADGSLIEGTYAFGVDFYELTITGGSGRFEGATGYLEYDPERFSGLVCGDPLCLVDATFESAYFEGWLSLPRP